MPGTLSKRMVYKEVKLKSKGSPRIGVFAFPSATSSIVSGGSFFSLTHLKFFVRLLGSLRYRTYQCLPGDGAKNVVVRPS
ncbi:unnamed protein product [Eruca vesicaria subsp. sativa]|uniref:Uncharacterized protein n=1 Tax=Eruca vesicaria subsp. sativa TaxID=29727 RepID=A0ABC8J1V8_ERUVS|nr:unnamed protein product [Eruca vesicaria subsp. sativa]